MATGGISFKAARKGDQCLHQGKVETGSGDTYTEDKKQARLGDTHSCKIHPPPPVPPGPGMGKIVTASTTVFVNNMGAARVTDLCLCMMQGPPLPDTASPKTSEYRVRRADNYQEMMVIEHEIAERDKVKDTKEPDKGATGEVDDPLGVAEAQAPPRPPEPPPSRGSITVKGKPTDQKPYSKEPPLPGGPSKTITKKDETPKLAGSTPMTPAAKKKDAPTAPKGGAEASKKEEKPREKPKVTIDLAFSMDLSIGMRLHIPMMLVGIDAIIMGASKVYIGGFKPPSVEDALATMQAEEEKKKKGGK